MRTWKFYLALILSIMLIDLLILIPLDVPYVFRLFFSMFYGWNFSNLLELLGVEL